MRQRTQKAARGLKSWAEIMRLKRKRDGKYGSRRARRWSSGKNKKHRVLHTVLGLFTAGCKPFHRNAKDAGEDYKFKIGYKALASFDTADCHLTKL